MVQRTRIRVLCVPLCGLIIFLLTIWLGGVGRVAVAADPVLLADVQQISAGGALTCALTTAGGVKCWGDNHFGQLGNASDQQFSTVPVDVTGLSSGVKAISAGTYHVCALTDAGGVKCWGKNIEGQLGDGTYGNRREPIDVVGLTAGVKAIVAGGQVSCAVTMVGGVKCWGNDLYGKLGNGELLSSPIPTDVVGLSMGVTMTDADGHVCAVTDEGAAKCWGYNFYGELGDGTTVDRQVPVDVKGFSTGVAIIAVGGVHTCALLINGGVKCWGFNEHGELGDGTQESRPASADVIDLTANVVAISASTYHTCALLTNGGVECWGKNSLGELGNGTHVDQAVPVGVSGLTNSVTAVTTGTNHTCALMSDGRVKCWGYNVYGELGDGTLENRSTPIDVRVPAEMNYEIYLPMVKG